MIVSFCPLLKALYQAAHVRQLDEARLALEPNGMSGVLSVKDLAHAMKRVSGVAVQISSAHGLEKPVPHFGPVVEAWKEIQHSLLDQNEKLASRVGALPGLELGECSFGDLVVHLLLLSSILGIVAVENSKVPQSA